MSLSSKRKYDYYSPTALLNLQKRMKNNFRVIEREAEDLERRKKKLLIDEVLKQYHQLINRLSFLDSDSMNYLLNLKVGNLIFGEELQHFKRTEGVKFLIEYALFIFYSKREEKLKVDTRIDGFNTEDFIEGILLFNDNFKIFQIKYSKTAKFLTIWFEIPA
jgi:hypothetical protein